MPGKFKIKKAKNGQFCFHLKASNGEIILASEAYKAKRSALNGIASVQKNSPEAARLDRRKGKGAKPYFVLKAANHQVIGQREMYESDPRHIERDQECPEEWWGPRRSRT